MLFILRVRSYPFKIDASDEIACLLSSLTSDNSSSVLHNVIICLLLGPVPTCTWLTKPSRIYYPREGCRFKAKKVLAGLQYAKSGQ